MFLKTESFEHNGVTVTLSELSALQRIEHLALLKRQAEQAGSSHQSEGDCGRSPSEPVRFWWRCPCGIAIRRRQRCRP
ncbi:bacteriophage lambda minor tail family protein [Escherichia coli p0305293.1]|nr:bacteriophage lambda minor tail family protein [Escherichia coli p0305293.1]